VPIIGLYCTLRAHHVSKNIQWLPLAGFCLRYHIGGQRGVRTLATVQGHVPIEVRSVADECILASSMNGREVIQACPHVDYSFRVALRMYTMSCM